jgi:hypothetical protein
MPKIRNTSSLVINDIQKELLWKTTAIRTYVNNRELYIVDLKKYSSFGSADLTLEINFDYENTTTTPILDIDGVEYNVRTSSTSDCPIGILKGYKTLQLSGSDAYVKDCTFGTTAGTSLEGNRFEQLLGASLGGYPRHRN